MRNAAAVALAAIALAGCAGLEPASREVAPVSEACPAGMPADARCLRGIDSMGAHFIIAIPAQWNQVLVVHAHGGPPLEAKRSRADEDAKRWAITVKAGYAWAASVYRQGGVAARSAAEDTERVRRIFVQHVARPRLTILHGQSWGAAVAARGAEMYTTSAAGRAGRSPYDGVLLTSGVLAGARSYDFRLDLRVVYQHFCGNHPRADEPQYPLWMGLPPGNPLTPAELTRRVEECLGGRGAGAKPTPEQARKLKAIADTIRVPESSVGAHLRWATFHFQDIVQKRTGGANPWSNERVRYQGSGDDEALNAKAPRYRADPAAAAAFFADMDGDGRIAVPVLTAHAIGDPTAMVEFSSAFRERMRRGGSEARLVQSFTDDKEHSYLADPDYPALFAELVDWIDHGRKPTPASVAQRCKAMEATFGPGCRFRTDYQPPSFESRVPAR